MIERAFPRVAFLALVLVVAFASTLALRADARPAAASRSLLLGPRPLETGVFPTAPLSRLTFQRIRGSGASVTRLILNWGRVAERRPPSRAEARDPAYEGYDWRAIDEVVRAATASGLRPILTIVHPPGWAADLPPKVAHGPWNVDSAALADFAYAAATRYSGRFLGLPRVRHWLVWNEPNLGRYLNPQFVNGQPRGGVVYRTLVNAVADAVHAVHRDNLLIAGATAPFTQWTPTSRERWGMGPLTFLRTMLCLSAKLEPTCKQRVKFDVWSHHPYTSGGPTHNAFRAADVSLGDLPEMRAVLDAGIRHRKIVSRSTPKFWITEFSWDTSPPDKGGVPEKLHARWVAEALYQAWRSGVSLMTWWSLRDDPYPALPFQSGLYFNGGANIEDDRPKPALQAFRFPFVGYVRAGRVFTWGRTPDGRPGRVRVEQRVGSAWRSLGIVRTSRYGIFSRTFATSHRGNLRARVLGGRAQTSRAFSLTRPKDRRVFPFGDWHP